METGLRVILMFKQIGLSLIFLSLVWLQTELDLASEVIGSVELRKREYENKTPTFRLPFTFAFFPLSENLEQAKLDSTQSYYHY